MPVTPPGFYHAVLSLSHVGLARSAAVTWGGENLGTPGDVSAVAFACFDAFRDAFGSSLDSEVTMGPTYVTLGTDGDPLIATDGTTQSGSSSGARSPANVALLFRKNTEFGGRHNKGRMYMPWALEDTAVDDVGNITGAAVTGWNSAASDFLTNLINGDVPMYVLHSEGPHGSDLPRIVISMLADNRVATQRRRLGR